MADSRINFSYIKIKEKSFPALNFREKTQKANLEWINERETGKYLPRTDFTGQSLNMDLMLPQVR